MVDFETIISILPNGNKAFIPTPTNVRPLKVFTGTSQESTIRGCKLLRLTIASYDTFDVSSMQFSTSSSRHSTNMRRTLLSIAL